MAEKFLTQQMKWSSDLQHSISALNNRNLHVAHDVNKHPTLFYLNGARRWWLRVSCAEIAMFETNCEQTKD